MPRSTVLSAVGFVCLLALTLSPAGAADEAKGDQPPREGRRLKALIVDGQNNHDWKKTTPLLKAALESSGRFDVDVATTPQDGNLSTFKPTFKDYDVVVSNYNGSKNTGGAWPEETQRAFEAFVGGGGGFVAVHAADNAFPEWAEYNKMIGVGGWAGRDERSGPYLRLRDGEVVRDASPGVGGSHGLYHEFVVETREPEHPVTKGLPAKWLHAGDELYDRLRGPAENVTVLATADAAKDKGGSGEHEPVLMAIDYGKGRVFHTTLGHDETSMKCVGFATVLRRGAEWAATGAVTQAVPDDFPTADKVSVWEPPAAAEGEPGLGERTAPAAEATDAAAGPRVELTDETYEYWRDFVVAKPEELRWQQIPWRPSVGAALAEAQRRGPEQKVPVLLWVMNGHPQGNC